MNLKKVLTVLTAVLVLTGWSAWADEGMWMINTINSALEKKMQDRGLKLSANEIYNADAPGASVSDAVVALGFYCTGSIISDEGLLITNHHCSYSDVSKLSTPEHNYLEDGFWAMTRDKEIPIKGVRVFFLKKVLDVTDEVNKMCEENRIAGRKRMGSRKISYVIENKYKNSTGYEASLNNMWEGEKYYLALYETFYDVRLVAAPPVAIAAFGGDTDNWEWPQQKCDFALYRVYTAPDGSPAEFSPENIPMKSKNSLKISLDGYKKGDFTMVIGYPGKTNRYSPSAEIAFEQNVRLPISNKIRADLMAIIKNWMDRDPMIRLKYSEMYFNLSNVQENDEGALQCFKRFGVVGLTEQKEASLQRYIDADTARMHQYGTIIDEIKTKYSEISQVERSKIYYQETLIRGMVSSKILMRMYNARPVDGDRADILRRDYDTFDPRVEKDLLKYNLKVYLSNVDTVFLGKFQKEILDRFTDREGHTDFDAMGEYLWDNSFVASQDSADRFTEKEFSSDELARFINDVDIQVYNHTDSDIDNRLDLVSLERKYTNEMYEMENAQGVVQYPDANSSMRISYGTVSDLEPWDGVVCSWYSTPAGIIQKYDPDNYEYHLGDRQKKLLLQGDWGRWGTPMHVDFLTDNDITGGNSGSPVLNAKGELIGLAFDGNKESLASDVYYTPGYNKCVCVDIRFVLWTLDKYAGMSRIIDELEFAK